jgi:hypothetical protein
MIPGGRPWWQERERRQKLGDPPAGLKQRKGIVQRTHAGQKPIEVPVGGVRVEGYSAGFLGDPGDLPLNRSHRSLDWEGRLQAWQGGLDEYGLGLPTHALEELAN